MKFARTLNIVILFMLSQAWNPVSGQSISRYKSVLSQPETSTRAAVSVSEFGSADAAVKQYDRLAHPSKISGYRIRIFFDNSQNARAEALETQSRFKSEFPGIPTFLVYENPSYTVTVGNCASIDEALMLWNKVKKSFNTAFLWRGELPIEDLAAHTTLDDDSASDPEHSQDPNISF